MVRTIKVKKSSQMYARGIHIMNPSEFELEQAKQDAIAKGFKTVWVHNKKMKKLKRII
jgi:hypothetical protein